MGKTEFPKFPTPKEIERSYIPPTDAEKALKEFQEKMNDRAELIKGQGLQQLFDTVQSELQFIDVSPLPNFSLTAADKGVTTDNLKRFISGAEPYYIQRRVDFKRIDGNGTPTKIGNVALTLVFYPDYIGLDIFSSIEGYKQINRRGISIQKLEDIRPAVAEYLIHMAESNT